VNVTVENLAPCKKLLRVEADAQTVDAAFEAVTADFQRKAALSGFRKGKAPRDKVAKQFTKEIEKEVRQKLARETYQFALKDQKLSVVAAPQFEEVQFGRGEGLQFHFTIETAPEFELPEYKGLPVRTARAAVTPEDIDRALTVLRERKGTYTDVDRPVENGDYVVVDYAGTCEGKPITDLVPTARGLTERKSFWLRVEKDGFLPGFAEQLVGAKAGDKRTVQVTFPPDFVEAALVNKPAVYEVGIVQVKVRHLPALDDELGKSYGAENLEKLREGVIRDLQNELKLKQTNDIRQQLVRALLDRLTFELPESLVLAETRNVVYNVVAENQKRGIPKESIDEKKDEIYNFANNNAKERVKTAFVLGKIAEKENLTASNDEITRRVAHMAQQYQIAPDKLVKQLNERNALPEIRDQIVHSKVLDFLQLHAKIEEGAFTPTVMPTA
jgi:trigger factor